MIEVKSKELLCVKCPIDNNWTLIEYCKKECKCGDNMSDENLECGYDKYIEERHRELNTEDKEEEEVNEESD